MKLIEAYKKLRAINVEVITTNDVAACLSISTTNASKLLSRMAEHDLLIKAVRGIWIFPEGFDPLTLPQYLTRPYPSYISLQTALYYHGFIEQIPEVIYAISIARPKRYVTPVGVFSIHHVHEEFMFAFDNYEDSDIKMAAPEKALIDLLYLTSSKTALFRSLPELEIPKTFSIAKCKKIIQRIPSERRKTLVKNRLAKLLKN